MKTRISALALVVGMFCAASGFAQSAASTAVSNATAAATAAASTAANNAVTKAKDSATAAVAAKVAPAPATAAAAPAAPAAAGGAGKVWVNKGSKTYHCEGSKFYGKTKAGEYMTEADAKAKGFRGIKGKACAK